MAVLTICLCVPFTRHNSLSRCSHIKQLQSKYRARLSFALRPITSLSNNIYALFKRSCYASRAMYRSFSTRGKWMQSAALLRRIWFVELCQIICWKGQNPFPPNGPQSLSECSKLPALLKHSLLLSGWPFPLVYLKIQEKWIILLFEQNTCLFSCIITFSYFIFVNLAWSVPITWHFSLRPKRVASTELLVFMYVNRFQKLHSNIFSACNYSAFFSFFCVFNELTFVFA